MNSLRFVCLMVFLSSPAFVSSQVAAVPSTIPQTEAPSPSLPQLHPRRNDGKAPIGSSILLDVVVTDKADRPVTGLQAQDFTLLDNSKRVPSASLQMTPQSPSDVKGENETVLVMDAVNSSLEEVTRSEEQIENFLRSHGGRLEQPTEILILSDTEPHGASPQPGNTPANVAALQHREAFVHRIPASLDGATLIQAIDENKGGLHRILESQGAAAESERVRLSLQALGFIATAEAANPGRKLVIWVGPGWPLLAQSDARTQDQLFNTVIYFSNLLREARIILYSVDPAGVTAGPLPDINGVLGMTSQRMLQATGHPPVLTTDVSDTFYESFLKGASTAKQTNPNDLALQVLAYQSGGLVLAHSNDLEAEIARCAADAHAIYTLTYIPRPGPGTDQYHQLELKLDKSGLAPRTRTGFYAK